MRTPPASASAPSALYAPPRPGRALYSSPLPTPQADGTSAIHILSAPHHLILTLTLTLTLTLILTRHAP